MIMVPRSPFRRGRLFLVVLLLAAVPRTMPATTADVESLPLAARGAIASVLGRETPVYHARPSGEGYVASNPRHILEASFTSRGVEIRSGQSRLGLALRAVGRGESLRPVARATPVASANRVEYRRGAVTEWYTNGPLGLEQGFTVEHRPARGSGALTVALELSGVVASLDPGAGGLTFVGSALCYRGLVAFDASGRELPARLDLQGETLFLRVEDEGSRYPVTIDPFVQQAKLTASDGASGDTLGRSVAISGDTVIVGAIGADVGTNPNQGAVYVFVKPAAGWANATETAKLTASDGVHSDLFGSSVAVSGTTVVVGARADDVGTNVNQGSAYVFVKPASGWASATETAKLTASDGAPDDEFGWAVGISGNTVAVGAPRDDIGLSSSRGSAYVFVKPASGWASATETAKLTSSDGAGVDFFGTSVAISGDTIVVGAPLNNVGSNRDQGSAYVFIEPATGWANATETAKLTASDGASVDWFGSSVATSSDTIVVGASLDDVGAENHQGSAYVFVEPASGWADATETAKLTASDGAAADLFGFSSAVSLDSIVIGARSADVGANVDQGSAYVFVKPVSGWITATETAKLTASDGASDAFGWSVAISGDTVVAGAPDADVGANREQGSAYIFAPPEGPGPPASLALSPASGVNTVGTTHTVTASVEDASAEPTPDIVIRFGVTGAVTTSGSCTTDAAGQCSFTYGGPQFPGTDVITAFADTDDDGVQDSGEPGGTATKSWILPVSTSGQVTGGGRITDADGNRITFAFEAKSDGGLKGGCTVVDQAAGRKVKCLDVTAFVLSGNEVTIFGNAIDNGIATIYLIQAVDDGKPRGGTDTFSIVTASGYSRWGAVTSGEIKIHD
ncbi:MAG TPA: post-COAP-1 domain-containing protein [Thermoanaerobaculia bacterium]|nr:post-COAP-1 domain-containing protein [Thermoanaerobaculia bacterium]